MQGHDGLFNLFAGLCLLCHKTPHRTEARYKCGTSTCFKMWGGKHGWPIAGMVLCTEAEFLGIIGKKSFPPCYSQSHLQY